MRQDDIVEQIAAGRQSETDREMMTSLGKSKDMTNELVDNTCLKF